MVVKPWLAPAAMASWHSWRSLDTTWLPMRPVPPITTIFIATSPFGAMLREWPMLRDKTLSACPNCLGFSSKAGRGHVGSGQGDVGPSTGREETLSERASGQIVLQIGRAHSELQSLMRTSYAVFCLTKKHTRSPY